MRDPENIGRVCELKPEFIGFIFTGVPNDMWETSPTQLFSLFPAGKQAK